LSKKGGLVVISGPSGVGKTTVVRELLKLPGITRSISATTRAPRGGEKDGVDYFFMTPERFEAGVAKQEFLEYAGIVGKRYGTPRKPVEEAVAAGKVVVLAIDVQGAATLKSMAVPFLGIFLAPPSMEELKRRLTGRNDTGDAEAQKRLALAMEELKAKDRYDVVITNDTVAETVAAVVRHLKERGLL
jgi:guanylate kinase